MRTIIQAKSFRSDYKKISRSGRHNLAELKAVVSDLENDIKLNRIHKEHELAGEWSDYLECHIRPDWLLIYEKDDENQTLVLYRTGSHSEL